MAQFPVTAGEKHFTALRLSRKENSSSFAKIAKAGLKSKRMSIEVDTRAIFLYFPAKKEMNMDEMKPIIDTPAPTSFMGRITNVFTSPGELFSEVAAVPVQSSSWVLPLIFSLLLGIVFTFALYNNPTLRQEIYDLQAEGMKQAVEQGKMTQEQMDQASEQMESSGLMMFMLIGGGSTVFFMVIAFFCGTLAIWLAAKFILKFTGGFKKTLELFGLVSMIGVFGSIVTLMLMYMLNTMHATPGGALLLLDSFDRDNLGHKLLASINVFTLWQTGVLGIGLMKLSGKSTGVCVGLAFVLWVIWAVAASLLGWVS